MSTNKRPDGQSRLFPGSFLSSGISWLTKYTQDENIAYTFAVQQDGNLVLSKWIGDNPAVILWSTQTNGSIENPYHLDLQKDGNLVLYDYKDQPLWASNVTGFKPRSLELQEDGNVVLYDADNMPRWATNTAGR